MNQICGQWKTADQRGPGQTRRGQPATLRTRSAAHAFAGIGLRAEWYGKRRDICRVHAALQTIATGPPRRSRGSCRTSPASIWTGPSGPISGPRPETCRELTFSWYAVDRTGQPWVVSLQTNWNRFPRHHHRRLAMMMIIKGMFGMIPIR